MDTIVLKTDAFKISDDEFFELCVQNRDLCIERTAKKEIIIISPSGIQTSAINVRLGLFLYAWNEKNRRGTITGADGGYFLPNGAMRAPNLAWIPKEKMQQFSKEEQSKFLHYCPEFVIELKSPSDKIIHLKAKMEEWIDNGCRLAWLIDPDSETAFVYKPDQPVKEIENFNHELDGEDILPGFKLKLSEIKDI